MRRKYAVLISFAFFCIGGFSAAAQEKADTDSIVMLLNAQYAKLFEVDSIQYREIKGPATFLHNGAYMFCDSAIWNLDTDVIDAFNNVRLVQDKTVLSSDHLKYIVAEDLAEFTGDVVELSDADHNIFRSNNLSYNTKDSVATSRNGGAMKDKDGNVIEGTSGMYDAKAHIFSFSGDTQVFMDTLFVRSTVIRYNSDEDRVYFGRETRLWYDDKFMRADDGYYDRNSETVNFRLNVYMNDPSYEAWCREAFYYRLTSTVELISDVQVLDTVHRTILLANNVLAVMDTVANTIDATLTQNPALVYYGLDSDEGPDSLFVAADTLIYRTRRAWQIDDSLFSVGKDLRSDILFDAIQEAEDKAADEYAKAKQAAWEKTPEYKAMQKRRTVAAQNAMDSLLLLECPVPDSLYTILNLPVPEVKDESRIIRDSLSGDNLQIDSLVHESLSPELEAGTQEAGSEPQSYEEQSMLSDLVSVNDTISARDTTSLAFFDALHNVRIYRNTMQGRCDTLIYSDVDSVAKMYSNPVIWENVKNQLTADQMMFLINEDGLYRGSMQQNAMITTYEDSTHFDQIKSTEMLGHFTDNELSRFDALGGVTALVYLREDDVLTTMNSKDSRFMMVTMKDGNAQRLKYYEQTKNDAYPVAQLDLEKQRLKGFNWRGDERPSSRSDVTARNIKTSERVAYSFLTKPSFGVTDSYFNNYMVGVFEEIETNRFRKDSLARVAADEDALEASIEEFVSDVLEPYLRMEDEMMFDQFRLWNEEVRLWGIEPQPKEPESSILSIKLQAQDLHLQKYNFSRLLTPIYKFIDFDLRNEGICFSGTGFPVPRNGQGSV